MIYPPLFAFFFVSFLFLRNWDIALLVFVGFIFGLMKLTYISIRISLMWVSIFSQFIWFSIMRYIGFIYIWIPLNL